MVHTKSSKNHDGFPSNWKRWLSFQIIENLWVTETIKKAFVFPLRLKSIGIAFLLSIVIFNKWKSTLHTNYEKTLYFPFRLKSIHITSIIIFITLPLASASDLLTFALNRKSGGETQKRSFLPLASASDLLTIERACPQRSDVWRHKDLQGGGWA